MPARPSRSLPSAAAREVLRAAGRHPLAVRVARALREACRVEPKGEIALATSGGGDSTAMLVLVAALAERGEAPSPVAMAIDHGLRPEARREIERTEARCASLGIPFVCRPVRVGGGSGNLLARARAARYAALVAESERRGIATLATAHQADDRLESILLAIGRGRGLKALASPRWRRRLSARVMLVRPLLGLRHAECLAFLEAIGVPWCEDSSNLFPSRARGFLRTAILPGYLGRFPAAARHAGALADEFALAARTLDRLCARRFGPAERRRWPASAFAGVELPLASWAIRRSSLGLDPAAVARVDRQDWTAAARLAVAAAGENRPPKRRRIGGLELRTSTRTVEIVRIAPEGTRP
jgi:tRNA(Ile)-lysidine synthetase-like protein